MANRSPIVLALVCGAILELVALLGWSAPASGADDDSTRVRVALQTGVAPIVVSSEGPIRIRTKGWSGASNESVTIRRDGRRLRVNNRVVSNPLRLSGTAGLLRVADVSVRGDLVVTVHRNRVLVVNEVDLEQYVQGVVPSEVPSDWPLEALKAQAILARTYVLHQKSERSHAEFDVEATVQSQVYGGARTENPRTSEAVAATAGRVVRYQGRVAFTPYHSTSAGRTEDAMEVWGINEPYLKGADCSFDSASPAARWTRRIPLDEIESALNLAGHGGAPIISITPLQRNRSGRVSAVRVLHGRGVLVLKGESLRRIIGYQRLPSMRFDVDSIGVNGETGQVEVWFSGGGWGHGVGLCQWGMKALAERGWTAERIVAHFYPGTTIDAHRVGAR